MTDKEIAPEAKEDRRTCPRKTGLMIRVLLAFLILVALGCAYLVFCPWRPMAPVLQNEEIGALEKRIDSLETKMAAFNANIAAPPAGASDTDALNETIRNLDARLAQIEKQKDQGAQISEKIIAQYFAFGDLREAARSGQGFTQQLASLRSAAGENAALMQQAARLEPYAAQGAPTYAQLKESLTLEEQKIPDIAENAETDSWQARLKSALQSLISVRSLHDARFAALEKAVEAQTGAAALEALKDLAPEVQQKLAPWREKLEARIAVDETLHTLATTFAAPDSGTTP